MTSYLLKRMQSYIRRYKKDESAATAIEYGLLIAFISVFVIGAVLAIGGYLEGFYEEILSYIESV